MLSIVVYNDVITCPADLEEDICNESWKKTRSKLMQSTLTYFQSASTSAPMSNNPLPPPQSGTESTTNTAPGENGNGNERLHPQGTLLKSKMKKRSLT